MTPQATPSKASDSPKAICDDCHPDAVFLVGRRETLEMKLKFKWIAASLLMAVTMGGVSSTRAETPEVALPPFYKSVTKLSPKGKLGQVLAKESIATAIPGAQAWRIAYVSSDVLERRTISTASVIAPRGPAPSKGRPIVAWAHGTRRTAQNCDHPRRSIGKRLNQYFLVGGNSATMTGFRRSNCSSSRVISSLERIIRDWAAPVPTNTIAATKRAVINSVRAAGHERCGGKTKAIIWRSQGRGAAIAAGEPPGIHFEKGTAYDGAAFVGFVGLAPDDVAVLTPKTALDEAAAERLFGSLIENFGDNVFNFSHFSMTLWANAATSSLSS